MTLHVQFTTMIVMIVGGFYLGIALETFRRLSITWQKRLIWTYCLEILFWVSHAFILFYMLYRVNAGEIRVYVILACLLGFSKYQALAAPLYKRLLEHIIHLFRRLFQLIKNTIYYMLVIPIRWIIMALWAIILVHVKVIFSMIKVVLTPIRWVLYLIYQSLPKKITEKVDKLPEFYSIIKSTSLKWLKFIWRRR